MISDQERTARLAHPRWLAGEIPWGAAGDCLRFPSRIMDLRVVGTHDDILLVETDVCEHFLGPRDWADGFASRLTWRACLRIQLHEWLVRLDTMVLGL